ncbi:hypothetical protein KIPB_008431, partial [Kipferlia bialata]
TLEVKGKAFYLSRESTMSTIQKADDVQGKEVTIPGGKGITFRMLVAGPNFR